MPPHAQRAALQVMTQQGVELQGGAQASAHLYKRGMGACVCTVRLCSVWCVRVRVCRPFVRCVVCTHVRVCVSARARKSAVCACLLPPAGVVCSRFLTCASHAMTRVIFLLINT